MRPRPLPLVILAPLIAVVALSAMPSLAADSASVFMYHRFGESDYAATNIRIDQFEAHLAEIASGEYHVAPLPDIIAAFESGLALPERTIALTIDDAFLSVYTEAWPRLKAAGVPFTLFVATDPVDAGQDDYMSWDQIRELVRAGVTIGSQTASHPHMPELSRTRNIAELEKSNLRFTQELGARPALFAYPFGEYGLAVRKAVVEAGFAAAFGQHSGVAYPGHDRFALPRFAMNETYGSPVRFKLAATALPLPVSDITPADTLIGENPPQFGFTVDAGVGGLDKLACYPRHENGPAQIERLGERRFEVRMRLPFPRRRGRVNCTVPTSDGRWRWFGMQFVVPEGDSPDDPPDDP
jgi:peptidoglycan/xylan/chitin deacetylase (PgdA/CDA1 family)